MLTKEDIEQLRTALQAEIVAERENTRKMLQETLDPLQKDVKKLTSYSRKLRKDLNVMLNHFDREQVRQAKEIRRIEDHLNLPRLS